jgi:hypothetical protein
MKAHAFALAAMLLSVSFARVAEDKAITLELKFPAGRVDKMVISQDLRQTLAGKDLPAPVNQFQKQTMDAVLKVGEGRSVEIAFERIRSSDNFRGVEVGFDSEKDKDSREPAARLLTALVGARLRMRFGADNKVEQFSGMNDMLDQLGKQIPGQDAFIRQLKQGLGDDAYKDIMNQALASFLPAKPVAVGDSWTTEQAQKLGGLGSIKLKLDLKLEAIEERDGRKLARIAFTGKGTLDGNFGVQDIQVKADEVEQKGVIYFDIDRGWLADQKIDQTIKGTVTVKQAGMERDFAVEQKGTFEVKMTPGS